MSDFTVTRTVVIANEQGLHARPADMFVRTAIQFEASVTVSKDSLRVDGKSILDVLTLGAAKDTELTLEATGSDAEAALAALAELVESNFSEPEQVDQQ
ncbi:MAG: HPr family phosphocarrier protein [Pirellulales bacterium]|nr:HPr family phosphocarrier protein [Pirellulales bacterium]